MTLKVTFILKNGEHRQLEAEAGQTLLEVAKKYELEVEGACGGAMACSTCHVIVDPAWHKKLPEAGEDETDMLDLAPGITKTSRLGCQIKLTPNLDGLIVKLPAMTKSFL